MIFGIFKAGENNNKCAIDWNSMNIDRFKHFNFSNERGSAFKK